MIWEIVSLSTDKKTCEWVIENSQEVCGQPSHGTFDFTAVLPAVGKIDLCKFHYDRTKNRARAIKRRWEDSGWGR